jgi:hypothetical protein
VVLSENGGYGRALADYIGKPAERPFLLGE